MEITSGCSSPFFVAWWRYLEKAGPWSTKNKSHCKASPLPSVPTAVDSPSQLNCTADLALSLSVPSYCHHRLPWYGALCPCLYLQLCLDKAETLPEALKCELSRGFLSALAPWATSAQDFCPLTPSCHCVLNTAPDATSRKRTQGLSPCRTRSTGSSPLFPASIVTLFTSPPSS